MSHKKIKWEFVTQERQANLFPFYIFAKSWGTKIRPFFRKNLNPIMLIFSEKGVEFFASQEDFHKFGKKIYNLFFNDKFYKKMNRYTDKYAKEVIRIAKLIEDKDIFKVREDKLVDYFKQINKQMLNLNKWGQLAPLTEYGSNNYIAKGLIQEIKNKLKNKKIDQTSVQIFGLLSSPIRSLYLTEERLDLLRIAMKILKENLRLNSTKTRKWIEKHQKQYCWINFGYVGPALDFNYFQKELKQLLIKNDIKRLRKMYLEKKNELEKIKKEQDRMEKELGFSKLLRKRFFIIRDQTYYKQYRKEVLFHGFYACELIQKELAKRWHLPLKFFKYILPHEYKKDEIRELYFRRKKLCVYYIDNNQESVYVGEGAKKIRVFLEIKGEEVEQVKQLKGNVACVGKVTGTVKIVIGVGHLEKLEKGDILVSFSTNPQMIIAMKKAGAIITEQGGIASHAAIVSREFRIPCLVGVAKVTKVLKDGDFVEVDAEKGIVKVIKKAK
ncbi:PEP-utilizing enzyme [Patescibacteria group bacterium AH-259-L07]|nr:PEP-utilizing enzyme [Patescibacteria group bacterium AH-259-L07]